MKRPDGVTLISIYHFIWAALTLLGICALIALPFIVGFLAEGDRDAIFWTSFASIVGLVFFGLFFTNTHSGRETNITGWQAHIRPWNGCGA